MVKRILAVTVVGALAVVVFFGIIAARGGGPEEDHTHDTGPDLPDGVVRITPDTHPNPDAAAVATATGLSQEQAVAVLTFQEQFGEYRKRIRTQYGDQIAATWMDNPPGTTGPNTRGNIQFVGEVPSGIETMEGVTLTGGGAISLEDSYRRAELAGEALVDLGYTSFVTYFDPVEKKIGVEVKIPEGSPQITKTEVVDALKGLVATEGLTGRAATIQTSDVKLTVTTGSGSFITNEHSRGGNWLLAGTVEKCTSGWSMSGPNGDGIVTAGHCSGLTKFKQPGVEPYAMTHWTQVWGSQGDAEYHTTEHEERAEFYSHATTIRIVTGTRSTSDMVGEIICNYGRSSNTSTCGHEIEVVNISTYDPNCPCSVGKMTRTDTVNSVGGDSGGPWFRSYTAWGIHKGKDTSGRGYFMAIEEVEDALDVTVKTQ